MTNSIAGTKLNSNIAQVSLPVLGAIAIVAASQLRIELGFTPVPITAQTLAVVVLGMVFGARQGASAVAVYLTAGALGMPVFAGFESLSALWGPTAGYLLGFMPAAWLAGFLTERLKEKRLLSLLAVAAVSALPIFVLGIPVLAVFVGWQNVMVMGVVPFLAGLVIKSVIAAGIVFSVHKLKR